MPRAEQAKHQYYHSQFTGAQYLPDSNSSTSTSPPPLSPASQHSNSQTASAGSNPSVKKKHVCGTCDRAFTTSGHLARHSRVHTGERNHKCPFPGCETRCSRQDNLQQHYRIHLSPGSRRSSTRSTGSRSSKKGAAAAAAAAAATQETPAPPTLSTPPPPLEPVRMYSNHSSPPDSPPPLAQATLPATATLPLSVSRMENSSDRSSSSSSPGNSYSTTHHVVPMSSQNLNMSGGNNQNYSYRSGTSTYQEQSQGNGGNGFQYVHANSSSLNNMSGGNSYSSGHDNYPMHSSEHTRGNTPASISSRHSISHISHPQSSYSQNNTSSAGPASPASSQSVSSHTSGPPTPTYPVFHNDGTHTYHQSNGMMGDQSNMNGNMNPQSHMTHNAYSSNAVHNHQRFDSPPPILAPIQDVRLIRHRDDRYPHAHINSYLHHPQPLATDSYPYHQSLGLGHGAWKGDGGMRKGVGALV